MEEIRKQKIKREKKQIKKKGDKQPTWAEPEAAAHLPTRTGTPFLFFSFPRADRWTPPVGIFFPALKSRRRPSPRSNFSSPLQFD
jgi:hypothetical protein